MYWFTYFFFEYVKCLNSFKLILFQIGRRTNKHLKNNNKIINFKLKKNRKE